MPPRTIQYSFAQGECSPEFLGGRVDMNRYFASCRTLENYVTLLTGGLRRAPGTRFIAAAKGPGLVRLQPFEFSIAQTYLLEMGAGYLRFYKEQGRLEDPPGTPVEVATPYGETEIFQVQCVQSADVLYLVHPDHAPRQLLRFSDTQWELRVMPFRPAPNLEQDFAPPATLTPSATSGAITLTASQPVFVEADVDRQVRAGPALAVVTALGSPSPAATVQATVLTPFSSPAPLSAGAWQLLGSPVADCTPSRLGPVGSRVILALSRQDADTPNLLPPGSWQDLSGPVIVSGTATGGAAPAPPSTPATLIDTSKNFLTLGVEAGHRVLKTSAPEGEARADTIAQTTNPYDTVTLNPALSGGAVFAAGQTYTIRETGSISGTSGTVTLNPGPNGVAWAQRSVAVEANQVYLLTFTVNQQPVTAQVGSTSGGAELFPETTFQVGEPQTLQFTATSAPAYVQFRNNQSPFLATVSTISLQLISVSGWRESDVGSFVQIFGGTVEIIARIDPSRVRGIIWWPLEPPGQSPGQAPTPPDAPIPAALAGAWVLAPPAWSATNGYPRAISFYQGRLAFGGTRAHPLGVWLSASGLFDTFALGPNDDQAVFVELSANKMNVIEWLEPLRDLLVGARGAEHLLRGGPTGITPSALEQLPLSENGSAPRRPLKVDNVLYQLARGAQQIYEVTLDPDLTQITRVRDLLTAADHLTTSGIRQWCAQTKPHKRLWLVRGDGQLLYFTLDLTEEVRGWGRRTTPGQFESVAVLPVDEPPAATALPEEIWVVVNRGNGRCIELMDPRLTLDSALSYAGPPVSQVSGLEHLEGQQVGVVADHAYATHTVSGGAITLDHPASAIDVGLEYTPHVGLPRLELPLRDGTMQTLKKRVVKAWVRLQDSLGLQINGQPVPFRRTGDRMDEAPPLQTLDVSQQLRGWSRDGYVDITQPLPFPSTIVTVIFEVEFEETG